MLFRSPTRKIDGLDIGPLLTGVSTAKSPHDSYWFYWGGELHAIRSGKWKLHFRHPFPHIDEPGADGRPGKISQHKTDLALYDLEADVSESNNVAAQNPEVVAKLTTLAEIARDDLGDSLTKRQGSGIRPAGQKVPAK